MESEISDIFEEGVNELQKLHACATKYIKHDRDYIDLCDCANFVLDVNRVDYLQGQSIVMANLFDQLQKQKEHQWEDLKDRVYESTNMCLEAVIGYTAKPVVVAEPIKVIPLYKDMK